MNRYVIRFNKTRGEPNRGSLDHVWRVFENDQEYLVKNVEINVPSKGEKTGEDWSIVCHGTMKINAATSTAIIVKTKRPQPE